MAVSLNEWHQKLGHLGEGILRNTLRKHDIELYPVPITPVSTNASMQCSGQSERCKDIWIALGG